MVQLKARTLSRWKTIFCRDTYAPDRVRVEYLGKDAMVEVDYRVTFREESIRIRAELHGLGVLIAIYHEDEDGTLSRAIEASTQSLAANGITIETQREILFHALRLAHYQRQDAEHSARINDVTRMLDRQSALQGVARMLDRESAEQGGDSNA